MEKTVASCEKKPYGIKTLGASLAANNFGGEQTMRNIERVSVASCSLAASF
jgi:hypothetical protein